MLINCESILQKRRIPRIYASLNIIRITTRITKIQLKKETCILLTLRIDDMFGRSDPVMFWLPARSKRKYNILLALIRAVIVSLVNGFGDSLAWYMILTWNELRRQVPPTRAVIQYASKESVCVLTGDIDDIMARWFIITIKRSSIIVCVHA